MEPIGWVVVHDDHAENTRTIYGTERGSRMFSSEFGARHFARRHLSMGKADSFTIWPVWPGSLAPQPT